MSAIPLPPESLSIDGEVAALPAPAADPGEIRRLVRQEGVLLQARGSAFGEQVFLCMRGRRHLVTSADRITELGLRWPDDVRAAPFEVLRAFVPGGHVPRLWGAARGTIDTSGLSDSSSVREAMASCLSGHGLEIGPGAAPFPVPLSCGVLFGDRLDHGELVSQNAHASPADAVARPDIGMDLDFVPPLREGTLDFVVACHVIEHTRDPIGAIERARRLLRPGGRLLLVVPDKHRTFDRHRPLTALDHLVQDFRHPDRSRDFPHYVEFFTLAFPQPPGAIEGAARSSFEREHAIHYHVWEHATFRQMLRWIQASPGRWSAVWTHPAVGDPASNNEFYVMLTR